MSDSEGSTLLLSPGSAVDDIVNANNDDVFAWLRPHSDTACAAFDASVNSALKNREKYEHARQFLHVSQRGNRAQSVYTEDEHGPNDASFQWIGAFKLSLKVPPRDSSKGWYFGTSRGRQVKDVEILLCPPIKKWVSSRVAGIHGRLYFHQQSCRMMLEARHTVTTTKNGVAVVGQSGSRVIEHGELLEIGHCLYIFEYTELYSAPAFEQDLIQFMRSHHGPEWSLNNFLSPSSVGTPNLIGGYRCSPHAFAQGTFGKVSAGWTNDGRPVAIKVFKKPKSDEIRGHQELMKRIGYHPNIVRLLDSVYQFDTEVPDAYCIYSPLAVASLSRLVGAYEFDLSTKSILLVDYLEGLAFLHEKGIMHRDINPNNLAVTSFNDPKGLIIDLDSATTHKSSTDHMQGTLAYLAPEIVQLKEDKPGSYDNKVDAWALGLSAYAMHIGHQIRWVYVNADGVQFSKMVNWSSYEAYQRKIHQSRDLTKDDNDADFFRLIIRMTRWDAVVRLTVSSAVGFAQALRKGQKGKIQLKTTLKRSYEE